jgi:hypothetical protein
MDEMQVSARALGVAANDEMATLTDFLQFYNDRAAGIAGVLRLTTIKPSMKKGKKDEVHSYPFAIGNVSDMALECIQRGRHSNVYLQLAVLRKDLPPGSRGKEADIIAGLAVVIDADRDKNGVDVVLPPGVAPTFILITSTTPNINRQYHYAFNRPVPLAELQTILELLPRRCGGDHCTGTITQPWRVPQTLNFPNQKKISRGRPCEPQDVQLEEATFELIDPEEFIRILESMPDVKRQRRVKAKRTVDASARRKRLHQPADNVGLDDLPDWVRDLIESQDAADRSAHSYHTMTVLMKHGLSDDHIRYLAEQGTFANKFSERGDLDEEIARVRERWDGTVKYALKRDSNAHNGHEIDGSAERSCNDIAIVGKLKLKQTGESDAKRTQANILIEIATGRDVELFHSQDRTAYADIMVNGHRETWALNSKGFRWWLRRAYYEKTEGAPNSDAMSTAMGVIEARAYYDGPIRDVHLRVAQHDDKVYLDLCDDAWRAAEIDDDGWRIVDNPTVRFRRTRGMLPIPDPVSNGDVHELKKHINVGDTAFVLIVSWLLAILRGCGPYPILAFTGEQGTGKTLAAEMLRSLLDPHTAPLRSLPRDTRDLYVAAMNGHILVFDNLSNISPEISDCLCRLSTGGGFSTRSLYTDGDEVLFNGQRPVSMTSITDVANRSDLADRLLAVALEPIEDNKRRSEKQLREKFEKARPAIVGSLLDIVAHGLKQLPETRLNRLPRMADYALWVRACETAIWSAGMHMAAYDTNRGEITETVLDDSEVATALRSYMGQRQTCTTTSGDLLESLNDLVSDYVRRKNTWPVTPRKLSGDLRRLQPALRRAGIKITHPPREAGTGRRLLTITNLKVKEVGDA